jgi:PAS domain S-box-containing protein
MTSAASLIQPGIETGADAQSTLDALICALEDAVILKSPDNIILGWNGGAEKLYGYSSDEMIGKSVDLLIPPDRRDELELFNSSLKRGEPVDHFETFRLTKDGRLVDVSLNTRPVRNASGEIIAGIEVARDVTERNRSQAAMDDLTQNSANHELIYDTASQVAVHILNSLTGVEALRHIVEAASKIVQSSYAALGVASPEGQGLMDFVETGALPEQAGEVDLRAFAGELIISLRDRTSPLCLPVVEEGAQIEGLPAARPSMRAFLGVPIRRGETILGVLFLIDHKNGQPFKEIEATAVQTLAAHAAVAIHNQQILSHQRTLVRAVLAAQEEERRSIAYDLHDGVAQYVLASHAHLQTFRHARNDANPEKAEKELEHGLRYLKEAIVESRRLINGQRALALDDVGLGGALEQLLNDEKVRAGWTEAFVVNNTGSHRYDKILATAAFRVAQEALTNARKHGETEKVRIMLLESPEKDGSNARLTLEIRDWGKGFDRSLQKQSEEHVGLQSMEERVRLLNGSFNITSVLGEGTVVRVVFPLIHHLGSDTQEGKP